MYNLTVYYYTKKQEDYLCETKNQALDRLNSLDDWKNYELRKLDQPERVDAT